MSYMEKETEKLEIETKPTSVRLPVDVLEILERWKEETGAKSIASCITTCVRVAAEDEKRITEVVPAGEIVLQEAEGAVDVIQIRKPKSRDDLADALTAIMHGTSLGANDKISALGVTRARVYKLTPEYQAARKIEPYSVYEDEKRLADDLSKSGGAGDYSAKMREKGEK
jgi:hypothetical protein